MNPLLRWFIYALWAVAALAVLFFVFFVHYDYQRRPTNLERWERVQRRADARRLESERQAREVRKAESDRKYAALLAEIAAMHAQIDSKWRADIEAAQVTANAGVVPPMLAVQEAEHAVTVTNRLSDRAVCVRLQRVARRPGPGNDFDRCRLDVESCREILPQASYRFQLYSTGNSPRCLHAPLEFRVGTPFNPEPTWWSRSALAEFDRRPAGDSLEWEPEELRGIRGNKNALQDLIGDPGRALRWRREFGPKIDTTKVEVD